MCSQSTIVAGAKVALSQSFRILVVEDHLDSAKALSLTLERQEYSVETTRNGTEALVVAARFRPHVALLDIGLPGLDGFYVARQLRRADPDLLLVAVTSRSSPEDRRLSREAGCDHHLVKPLDFEILNQVLDDWKQRHIGKG
jgi:two-component system CheB/CheR fusion protein